MSLRFEAADRGKGDVWLFSSELSGRVNTERQWLRPGMNRNCGVEVGAISMPCYSQQSRRPKQTSPSQYSDADAVYIGLAMAR